MKWVARCKLPPIGLELDKDLSPSFDSIDECLIYIHTNLQVLEYLLKEVHTFFDLKIDNKLCFRFGSYIRPYCKSQKRFCDSFDF